MVWRPFGPGGSLGLEALQAYHYHQPSQLISFWVDQKVVLTPFPTFWFFGIWHFLKKNSYRPNRLTYTIFFKAKMCRNVQITKRKMETFFPPNLSKNRYFYRFFSYHCLFFQTLCISVFLGHPLYTNVEKSWILYLYHWLQSIYQFRFGQISISIFVPYLENIVVSCLTKEPHR